MNVTVSYNDILLQNEQWAQIASTKMSLTKNFLCNVPTHVTLDNNDGVQETITGRETTHDTNITIFQTIT